ncbi:hypothetical protein AeRB84_007543 [Aphanomyces euteiches]|nr:hypothetical protein AeRB84_007543 [Aphanomyces euteiches]
MFAALDDKLDDLGVLSYGISVSTLEEVFIKVAELGDEHHQHTLQKADPTTTTKKQGYKLTDHAPDSPLAMFFVHFRALFKKRWRTAKRDKRIVIFGTVLPVLFLVLGMAMLKISSLASNDPSLPLTTADYPYQSHTPLPYLCESDWMCDSVNQITQAKPEPFTGLGSPVYSTGTPTVFGVQYANLTDAKSFSLKAGEEIFQRGYGKDDTSPVLGQYGGFVFMGNSQTRTFGYNVAVNTTAIHALFRTVTSNSNVQLTCTDTPLPLTGTTKIMFTTLIAFSATAFVVLAFAFFTASVVPYLVHEKHPSHNAKHQQLVSGVSLPAFWLANFAWDLVLYAVPCLFGLLAIFLFDITPFTGRDCASCPSAPFAALTVLFGSLGLPSLASATSSPCLSSRLPPKQRQQVFQYFWRLSPLFCVGNGLNQLSLATLQLAQGTLEKNTSAFSMDVVGWEVVYLAFEAVLFPLLAIAMDYALSFPKIKAMMTKDPDIVDAPYPLDEDVRKEADRIASGAADKDAVVMRNLRKVYKEGKVGVVDLSLALPKGECFGYLGINGAGKTTTMKILTGDVLPTSGSATLGGFDIMTQQLQVRRLIGYCPQFDALIDLMTVREHLELFAAIKGVPSGQIGATVKDKMEQMNLNDFEHKLAGTLSGGNKRKLSVAIAMIGSPPIIFLDEPSTGMDPVSRRFMWDVIAAISTRSKESTILLTTHSMEECEALCTRVAFEAPIWRWVDAPRSGRPRDACGCRSLANASFDGETMLTKEGVEEACSILGKPHRVNHMTSSHVTGYVLADALNRNGCLSVHDFCGWWLGEDRFDAMADHFRQSFGNVLLLEHQNDVSRFKLLGSKRELALSIVEKAKTQLRLEEYTVSQTTLEQIFNNFASQQTQEKGVARGMQVTVAGDCRQDNYLAMP